MRFSKEEKACGLRTGGRAERMPGSMQRKTALFRIHSQDGPMQKQKADPVLWKSQQK